MGQSGFDMKKLSMGSKGALIAGGLLFIDLFLPWNCAGGGQIFGQAIPKFCVNGFNGMGMLAGLLLLVLLVWEGLGAAGALASVSAPKKLITAALAAGAALFALLRFLFNIGASSFGAWLGVILALALAYAAWASWQEHQSGAGTGGAPMPPAAPPMG